MTGPGRPPIGPAITLRLPADLLKQLDRRAKRDGVTRAELVRQLLSDAL